MWLGGAEAEHVNQGLGNTVKGIWEEDINEWKHFKLIKKKIVSFEWVGT